MVETLHVVFTSFDRCDRCDQEAHLRALLPTGVLLFCGHHAREHHGALVKAGAYIEADS